MLYLNAVPREITVQGSVRNLDLHDWKMVCSSQVVVILCCIRTNGIGWDRTERIGGINQSVSKLSIDEMWWNFVSQFERGGIGMLNAEIQAWEMPIFSYKIISIRTYISQWN